MRPKTGETTGTKREIGLEMIIQPLHAPEDEAPTVLKAPNALPAPESEEMSKASRSKVDQTQA